jgi:hypothetical protein
MSSFAFWSAVNGTHVSDVCGIFQVPNTNGAAMAPTTATGIAIFQRLTLRWFSWPGFSASSAIGTLLDMEN